MKITEDKLFEWVRALEVNVRDPLRTMDENGLAGYLGIITHEMREELKKTPEGRKLLEKKPLAPA